MNPVEATLAGPLIPDIFVWVDQVFPAGRRFAINCDVVKIQRFDERYLGGIGAGEGGFQLRRDALLESLHGGGSDLLQEGVAHPPADSPGHAHAAADFYGAGAEAAVDIDLLVNRRAVAAVLRSLSAEGGFHAGEDLTGELAAARSEE